MTAQSNFSKEYYCMMRAQYRELDRPSRDLVVMGFLMALQDTRERLDYDVTHRSSKDRERFRGSYFHAGYKVLDHSDSTL